MKTKPAKEIQLPELDEAMLICTLNALGRAANRARRFMAKDETEKSPTFHAYYSGQFEAFSFAAAWLACDLGLAQMIDDRPADALAKAA